ncbi:Rrf2 family transcriptional regulator [Mangrovicoccus algicola]|uniref:Rrf2 family transcriptional regulator n=1 Tax=Mangrovicoccus algicola TaxID=2771008 RepID=A0A8J7CVW4_9RHOB|nr:Rrf2 family transcriptional regulator [Mangrovicoccus algicola]MBE3636957.1 Rrf2 family transcriptional regulator [Mangrovicoccus algicola]
MRLTLRTNLAMRTLMFCAVNDGRTVRKAEVARACNASENHLAHVIVLLGQQGVIRTTRGRNGGLRLARPPGEIDIGAVIRALESSVPFAECFEGAENHCPIAEHCRLRGVLGRAVEAFYAALDGIALSELTTANPGLSAVLGLGTAPGARELPRLC